MAPPVLYARAMTTTHPSIQPVLRQGNVTTLLNHLKQLPCPTPSSDLSGPEAEIFRDGFYAGLAEAENAIRMMWQAAVIASHAAELEATRRYEELVSELGDLTDDTDDTLGELASIASDLLALADRLDRAAD